MKSVKFARIGLILIQNDSPHRVLDSWGGFGQFFQKIGKKIKFEISEKSRFFGFFGEIPKQTARPRMNLNRFVGIVQSFPGFQAQKQQLEASAGQRLAG